MKQTSVKIDTSCISENSIKETTVQDKYKCAHPSFEIYNPGCVSFSRERVLDDGTSG